ncbi:MAG: hypothetical protein ABFD69_12555 [Candidatus Sumerlaeia bacterium]
MNQVDSKISGRDAAWAAGLAALLAVAYASLIQFNLTWDGAFFVREELGAVRDPIETHLLFGPWLRLWLVAGAWLHLEPRVAGSLQSAVTMACAMGLFFLALRRCGTGRGWAAVFTLLMGCNAPVIENATTVEVYAPAVLAVMLSLHAFLGEAASPGRRGAIRLIAACILVAFCHAGYCFWILSAYLALGLYERRPARFALRMAQGAVVVLALVAVKYAAARAGVDTANSVESMYRKFYLKQSVWMHAVNIAMAPADSIQAFAGLAIFPAVLGWRVARRRLGALAIHAVLSLILFIAFFHAWNIDFGNFYLPVMMPLGIFAALGCEAAFRNPARAPRWPLGVLAMLTVVLVILPFQDFRFIGWIAGGQYRLWLGVMFYILVAAQWILAGRLERSAGAAGRRPGIPAMAGVSTVLLAVTLFCYLPMPLERLKPDQARDYSVAVKALMRGRDLSRQRLITGFFSCRVELETGITACSASWIGKRGSEVPQYDQHPASEWIRDTARGTDPLQVWIDAGALAEARKLWNRGLMADIPIDLLEFRPVAVECDVPGESLKNFYEIKFKDPAEARRHGLRLDPYPAEDWGGTPVTWTRPRCEQTLRRQGEWLEFKYWVGHDDLGTTRPVRVEIFLNGAPVYTRRHDRDKLGEPRLRVPAALGPEITLAIRVTPARRAKEGRDLGVGLYPFKWVDE